jgi:hypothetical protein
MNITIEKTQLSEWPLLSSCPQSVYMVNVAYFDLQSDQYLDFAQQENHSK